MSAERAVCQHDVTEREVAAVADGLCPLCLQRALADAQREVARLTKESLTLADDLQVISEQWRAAEQRAAALAAELEAMRAAHPEADCYASFPKLQERAAALEFIIARIARKYAPVLNASDLAELRGVADTRAAPRPDSSPMRTGPARLTSEDAAPPSGHGPPASTRAAPRPGRP